MIIRVDVVSARRHTTYTNIHSWNIITLCQVGRGVVDVVIGLGVNYIWNMISIYVVIYMYLYVL